MYTITSYVLVVTVLLRVKCTFACTYKQVCLILKLQTQKSENMGVVCLCA
jgi:hypothetical protein